MTQHSHRQYPPPERPWFIRMVWHDLLFAHWPVDPAVLRALVPEGLEIDTAPVGPWAGRAFIGIVPFWMSGVRARLTPALPWLSTFPELNVRTYVWPRDEGRQRPGVYFFSLDAASLLTVVGARAGYGLLYYLARMRCRRAADGWIDYETRRTHPRGGRAEWRGRYRPAGEAFFAPPGSIESFITDRYCLYTADRRGRIWRAEIDHPPWPLQAAEARVERDTMATPLRVRLDPPAPMLHYAERMDVVAWTPERVRMGSSGRRPA